MRSVSGGQNTTTNTCDASSHFNCNSMQRTHLYYYGVCVQTLQGLFYGVQSPITLDIVTDSLVVAHGNRSHIAGRMHRGPSQGEQRFNIADFERRVEALSDNSVWKRSKASRLLLPREKETGMKSNQARGKRGPVVTRRRFIRGSVSTGLTTLLATRLSSRV